MARMIPSIPDDFHGSRGEERLFNALRALPDRVTVIHSFRWLHPGEIRPHQPRMPAQGEGDFVLFDRTRGIMVVEVKGGDVWCEDGEWNQRNRRTGQVLLIHPERQASNTMHRIMLEVQSKVRDARAFLFCHAVWFPDGEIDKHNLPMNLHSDITLDSRDVMTPVDAIDRAFKYWQKRYPQMKAASPETAANIFRALAPTRSVVRSVRQAVDEREELLIRLTREQARVLEFLDEQPHAAIVGAAGTGKTLLAIEKARRLAGPTEHVLFLCYNAALREHLETHHHQVNVRYVTFHGFAREIMGPDGTLDEAVEGLLEHLADGNPIPYTHAIIDEGQDFDHEWLEFLRLGFQDGAFYVFYDRHQTIQGEGDTRWLDEIPCRLVLTRNCRNPDPIARVAYRAAGLPISPTLGVSSPRPVVHSVQDAREAVRLVESLIKTACGEHKLPPHEIAVQSLETIDSSSPWSVAKLGGRLTSENPREGMITVTTVRRFKGLEAALVIAVDVDLARAEDLEWRRRLYVACSRARHGAHIVTTTPEEDLGIATRAFAGTEKARASWRALARQLGVQIGGGQNDPFLD